MIFTCVLILTLVSLLPDYNLNRDKYLLEGQPDSLSKYSYVLMQWHKGKSFGHGTGFFIRNSKKLFLISNYHVFTGQNLENKKSFDIRPDSLSFCYMQHGRMVVKFLNVQNIVKSSKSYNSYEIADSYAFDVKSLYSNNNIFSVERLLKKVPLNEKPIDILTFSFGGQISKYMNSETKMNPEISHYNLYNTVYDNQDVFESSTKETHTMRFTYLLNGISMGGMSGSPIFYIYKSNKVVFGGIISSHVTNRKLAIIVKPQEICKQVGLNYIYK